MFLTPRSQQPGPEVEGSPTEVESVHSPTEVKSVHTALAMGLRVERLGQRQLTDARVAHRISPAD